MHKLLEKLRDDKEVVTLGRYAELLEEFDVVPPRSNTSDWECNYVSNRL